ncbi:MAG: Hpt domain-containing protein [Treponema sp.]|nr:Hpt domain-containing protein [Treponema sp.]
MYADSIHTLKGISRSAGARELVNLAGLMEKSRRSNEESIPIYIFIAHYAEPVPKLIDCALMRTVLEQPLLITLFRGRDKPPGMNPACFLWINLPQEFSQGPNPFQHT